MIILRLATPAVCGFLTLILVSSCATNKPTPKGAGRASTSSSSVAGPIVPPKHAAGTAASPAEERDYREAYTLYSRAAYELAIQKLQAFENKYPRSALTSHIHNLHGLSFLLLRRPAQGIPHFQRSLTESRANPALSQYLLYNLADAQFEAGQIEEAQKTALTLLPESMDKENRIKAHYLKARINTKRELAPESARECLSAGKLLLPSVSRETQTAVSTLLDQNLDNIPDLAIIEELYHSYEDSTLADRVLMHMAMRENSTGLREKSQAHLKELMSRYPESASYSQAAELVNAGASPDGGTATNSLRDTHPVDSTAVGLLLPMKGKFAKFGARNLQGIELAFRIYNANEPDSKITLVVEDSGEDTESAVRALDKLVTKHHVVAVIGPLLSKGIDQVTQRAQELGVPLISLSRHIGVQNDYVFQAGLTVRLQTREIVRYAIEKLGLKRFAMIYPRDKVGEDSMQKFWDAVETQGGTVTGIEAYNLGETDFRQAVDRLSGLYYADARWRESEALALERQINNIKRRTRKTEQYFSLKPIVDYDAVFIPEEPKVAGQILPTFAYRDVDHIKFLGTSAWNSPELATRAPSYAENAYFLDAFFPESNSPTTRRYIERFKETFNQEATAMDALAYDAAHILENILSRNGGLSRAELRDKLHAVKNFAGVTGAITYQDGQFNRNLKILTTKAGNVVEVTE